ncbi:MAG: helix-turn-helix domain-containing protein [Acidimicrobiales bacterium]
MDHERWSSDLNLLCERLAEGLAEDGATHADAAALTIAVRGLRGLSAGEFAAEVGIGPAELSRIETGEVAWADLPPVILRLAAAEPRLDLDRLAPPGAATAT